MVKYLIDVLLVVMMALVCETFIKRVWNNLFHPEISDEELKRRLTQRLWKEAL